MLGELLAKHLERHFAAKRTIVVVHDGIWFHRSIRNLINDLYLQEMDYHRYRHPHVSDSHFSSEAMPETCIVLVCNATNIRGQSFLVRAVSAKFA